MAERRPNRTLGGPHDDFWQRCADRELWLQRCEACAAHTWPPKSDCENCGNDRLTWSKTAGTGTLVSWAVFEHRYHAELPLPWPTILVELDEGPLFISNPVDLPVEGLRAGMPLRVCFIECEDAAGPFLLPAFTPRASTSRPND